MTQSAHLRFHKHYIHIAHTTQSTHYTQTVHNTRYSHIIHTTQWRTWATAMNIEIYPCKWAWSTGYIVCARTELWVGVWLIAPNKYIYYEILHKRIWMPSNSKVHYHSALLEPLWFNTSLWTWVMRYVRYRLLYKCFFLGIRSGFLWRLW